MLPDRYVPLDTEWKNHNMFVQIKEEIIQKYEDLQTNESKSRFFSVCDCTIRLKHQLMRLHLQASIICNPKSIELYRERYKEEWLSRQEDPVKFMNVFFEPVIKTVCHHFEYARNAKEHVFFIEKMENTKRIELHFHFDISLADCRLMQLSKQINQSIIQARDYFLFGDWNRKNEGGDSNGESKR